MFDLIVIIIYRLLLLFKNPRQGGGKLKKDYPNIRKENNKKWKTKKKILEKGEQ